MINLSPELLTKTPIEISIVSFDFVKRVEVGETVTAINAVTITRVDGVAMGGTDLTKDTQSFSGTKVQLKVSKGLDGVVYHVKVEVVTSAGQILEGCGHMQVGNC